MVAKIEIECKTVSQLHRHLVVMAIEILNLAESEKIDMETEAFKKECKISRTNEHGSHNAIIKPYN